MWMVGVEPELLEPPLLVVLALPPPPPPLVLVFELEPPHAATANAVIATSSSAASGRTNLFKLILLREGWSPSGERIPKRGRMPPAPRNT
jgi:hypothetical protein